MRRPLALITAVVALLGMLAVAPAPAEASVLPMQLDDLVTRADAIVVVNVADTRARPGRGTGVESAPIVTDAQARVTRVLKGSRPDAITVVQPGGTLGDTTLEVSELPEFTAGERALLFLNAQGGVVGGYQGKVALKGDRLEGYGATLSDVGRMAIRSPQPPVSSAAEFSLIEPGLAETTSLLTAAGTVGGISPEGQNAGIGDTVAITGSGFGSVRGSGKVEFVHGSSLGGAKIASATYLAWSDSRIVCIVPRRAASGPVVVTNDNGVASAGYSYRVGFSTGGLRVSTSSPFTYRINENTADVAGEAAAIRSAMSTWNGAGSNFRLAYGGATNSSTNPPGSSNGYNDIYFSSTGFTDSGILGWNRYLYSGTTIAESDIVFNDTYSFSIGAVSGRFDIESVALHELGHTVGLDDQYSNTDKAMGAAVSGRTRRQLSSAELNGAFHLYGGSLDTEAPSAPALASESHPDQSRWYSTGSAEFAFLARDNRGVTGYSYVLDGSPSTSPDSISEGTAVSRTYTSLAEGVRYFHVRARDAAGNWGPSSHYRIQTDRTAPRTSHDGVDAYTQQASILLTAEDSLSGVSSTRWTLDGVEGSGLEVASAAQGPHTLTFSSTDAAGNAESTSELRFTVYPPPTPEPVPDGLSVAVPEGAAVFATATAPATASQPPATGSLLFDEVSAAGRLALSRSAADPISGWRVLGSVWHPLFDGECTGTVSVSLPYEPLLTQKRVDRLRVLHFVDGKWETVVPGIDAAEHTLTARIDCLGPLAIVEPSSVDASSRLSVDARSSLTPAYGSRARVVVRLADAYATPLSGRLVELRTSTGVLAAVLRPSEKTAGVYVGYAPVVASRTAFSARFEGDGANSGSSATVVVLPKAALRINAPATGRRYRGFYVYGSIRPVHESAGVRIEVWKKARTGRYVRSTTIYTRTSTTAFKGKVSLPAGYYRIRAVHADYKHATSVSRWDYVRVR